MREGRDKILDQLFVVPIGKGANNNNNNNSIPRLKRNLALINESVPSEQDTELPAAEVKAREMIIQNRAKSSAKNPNLMLSTTCLVVHHLPPCKWIPIEGCHLRRGKRSTCHGNETGQPLKLSKKNVVPASQFETISKIHSGMHQIKIILHKSKNSGATEDKSAKSWVTVSWNGVILDGPPLRPLVPSLLILVHQRNLPNDQISRQGSCTWLPNRPGSSN